jgi:hypothetical protein
MRVQLTASSVRALAACGPLMLLAAPAPVRAGIEEQEAGWIFEFFSDSDDVVVTSNSGGYGASLTGDARLDVSWKREVVRVPGIDAIPGTDEAVDAITSASRPISGAGSAYQDFTKTRNEAQGNVAWKGLSGGYYVSQEEDYFAQQVSAGGSRVVPGDIALSFGASYGWDDIEPLEDDDGSTTPDSKTTKHANVVATRAMTPTTELQGGVEITNVEGLQHSPYRNVYVDGARVPERHPDQRSRRAAFLKVSQYFRNRSSVRVSSMLYEDDWGVSSHTLNVLLHQYVTDPVRVRYRYRYYTQDAADFWRDEYTEPNGVDGFQSGDYRLSSFSAHLLGARIGWDLGRPFGWKALEGVGFMFQYERYFNTHNFSANLFESGFTFTF